MSEHARERSEQSNTFRTRRVTTTSAARRDARAAKQMARASAVTSWCNCGAWCKIGITPGSPA